MPGASKWTNLRFRATGSDGINTPATSGTVAADGMTVTVPTAASTAALPNTIKWYNKGDGTAFTLNWQLSVDGGNTWAAISSTKHTVYVTLGDPPMDAQLQHFQETTFYIGCKYANGASTQNGLLNGIWADFQGRKMYRISDLTHVMTYYANDAAPYSTCNEIDDLLATGDGRCGSFQQLMLVVLYNQGVPPDVAKPKIVTPSAHYVDQAVEAYTKQHGSNPYDKYSVDRIRDVFFVKKWKLNVNSPFNPIDQFGIPAQGKENPIAIFGDHALVEVNGKIYDPSYGDGPYQSVVAWQDASIDGFGVQFIDSTDLAAFFLLFVGKLELLGVLNVDYNDP